jgi:hypothetical protein
MTGFDIGPLLQTADQIEFVILGLGYRWREDTVEKIHVEGRYS